MIPVEKRLKVIILHLPIRATRIAREQRHIAVNQAMGVLLQRAQEPLQRVRFEHIVGVYRHDVASVGCRNRCVQRRCGPPVRVPAYCANGLPIIGQPLRDLPGIVCRTVVTYHHLKALERLPWLWPEATLPTDQTRHEVRQVPPIVVTGGHHTDERRGPDVQRSLLRLLFQQPSDARTKVPLPPMDKPPAIPHRVGGKPAPARSQLPLRRRPPQRPMGLIEQTHRVNGISPHEHERALDIALGPRRVCHHPVPDDSVLLPEGVQRRPPVPTGQSDVLVQHEHIPLCTDKPRIHRPGKVPPFNHRDELSALGLDELRWWGDLAAVVDNNEWQPRRQGANEPLQAHPVVPIWDDCTEVLDHRPLLEAVRVGHCQ